MRGKSVFFAVLLAVAATMICPRPVRATDTTLHDGFKAASLDTLKWALLSGSVSTNFGVPAALQLLGDGAKRINSKASFGSGTFALGRAKLAGNYQKFGFSVNAAEGAIPGEVGAYFDTLEPAFVCSDNTDTVYARVIQWGTPSSVPACDPLAPPLALPYTVLFEQQIAVSWGDWHVFKIAWMPGDVEFHVDGVPKGTYASPLGGSPSKPIGVWNDRASEMLVDWMFGTPMVVSLAYADFDGILADLDGANYYQGCSGAGTCNPEARVTEFSEESGVLFSSSIHTTTSATRWFGIFILNEGADWSPITFTHNQPDPFESNSTPPGTEANFDDLGWNGTFPSAGAPIDFLGAVKLYNITLKYPPKGGLANIHLGLGFERTGVPDRIGINVHVKP